MSKYSNHELEILVKRLLDYPTEQTWFEFKHGNDNPERIGRYASALANCACAAHQPYGYLIWGIEDPTHRIVGTHFDPDTAKVGNQSLRLWLHTQLRPELSMEFYKCVIDGCNVVVLEVEAAYRQPIAFKGTAYGRVGESLQPLSTLPEVAMQIYRTVGKDWSAEILLDASRKDLDDEAVKVARERYSEKHKNDVFYSEIAEWDDMTFLNKAKLAIDGKITRAAIILLGKPESTHFLHESVAKITWNLLDSEDNNIDYKHFEPPFLLAVDKVYAKIRNLTLRTIPPGTLFPVEINQYDEWVFREALHNCIAHQDYYKNSSITISECPDRIVFANAGTFLPGTIENVLFNNKRPRFYPNRLLAEAMVELNMIDTIGSGIRRMFMTQKNHFMPLPEYQIEDNMVMATLYGKILDVRYTHLLIRQPDLKLSDIILLDKLQKGKQITKDEVASLRSKKLIEGRYPHVFPSAAIAAKTETLPDYLSNKGFDDAFYIQRILEFICWKGQANKAEISNLLNRYLPQGLTEDQKRRKVGNLLSLKMAYRLKLIVNKGVRSASSWHLTDRGRNECKKGNLSCKKECKKEKA